MRTFTNNKTVSSVKRLTYSGSPSKGTTSVVYQNLKGYLRPLSEESSAVNQMQWGTGFHLITEIDSPILTGDILTIDSEIYTVRGQAKHDRGRQTSYFKYLLVKKQA